MSDQIEEDAEFVDGEECDRNCDGTRKICRFKFNVENFNSMGKWVNSIEHICIQK